RVPGPGGREERKGGPLLGWAGGTLPHQSSPSCARMDQAEPYPTTLRRRINELRGGYRREDWDGSWGARDSRVRRAARARRKRGSRVRASLEMAGLSRAE